MITIISIDADSIIMTCDSSTVVFHNSAHGGGSFPSCKYTDIKISMGFCVYTWSEEEIMKGWGRFIRRKMPCPVWDALCPSSWCHTLHPHTDLPPPHIKEFNWHCGIILDGAKQGASGYMSVQRWDHQNQMWIFNPRNWEELTEGFAKQVNLYGNRRRWMFPYIGGSCTK